MLGFAPAIPSRNDLDWCGYLRRQGREGEALERVLHDIGVMNPSGWADWAPSALTQTGAPVEMIFADGDTGLSMRTEVADPASDPCCRLSQVCRVMTELGGSAPGKGLRDVLYAAQSVGNLRFGARLGLHQSGDTLRTRLYAEIPAESRDLTGLIWPKDLCRILDECGPDARTTMLCYDATTGDVAMHFAMQRPDIGEIHKLANVAGVSGASIADAIAQLSDKREMGTLPMPQMFFCLAPQPKGAAPVLTVFLQAADLFDTDSHAAAGVESCAQDPMAHYDRLVDILPAAPKGRPHHGQIGLTARAGAAPVFSVGVSAPWSYPFEVH